MCNDDNDNDENQVDDDYDNDENGADDEEDLNMMWSVSVEKYITKTWRKFFGHSVFYTVWMSKDPVTKCPKNDPKPPEGQLIFEGW